MRARGMWFPEARLNRLTFPSDFFCVGLRYDITPIFLFHFLWRAPAGRGDAPKGVGLLGRFEVEVMAANDGFGVAGRAQLFRPDKRAFESGSKFAIYLPN